MRLAHTLLRLVGWLLTPLVAWAASFGGAWFGSAVVGRTGSSSTAFWITVAFGAVAALTAVWAWLRLLRRSSALQETLAVAPDGTPLAAIADDTPRKPE